MITSRTDIAARVQAFVETGQLPDYSYSYVVEYFNEEDIPHALSDGLAVKDFARSEDVAKILAWTQRQPSFDFVLSADEFAVYIAGLVRDVLKLPGPGADACRRYRDKWIMTEMVKRAGVDVPGTYDPASLPKDLRFPVIVKPRALAGAVGVKVVESWLELGNALGEADTAGSYVDMSPSQLIVQERLNAPLYHVDFVVQRGRCEWGVVSVYSNTPKDYLAGTPLVSRVVAGPNLPTKWSRLVELVLQALVLNDGVYHLEAFDVVGRGLVFLEIGYRPGGALVVPLLHGLFGVDLLASHLMLQLGHSLKLDRTDNGKSGAWIVFPKDHVSVEPRWVSDVRLPRTPFASRAIFKHIPRVGDRASGEFFCHEDSLGSFAFVGLTEEIDRDIETLLREYEVKTTSKEVYSCPL